MALKIYRIKEVCDITGLSRSSVYKLIRLGLFPSGIKLTHRSSGWSNEQLEDWLRAKVKAGVKS